MKKSSILLVGIMLALTVFTTGCFTETDDEEPETVDGTLQLKITDKPKDDLDIVHAYVNISMVQVHTAAANNTEDDEEDIDENDDGLLASVTGRNEGVVGEDIDFGGVATGGIEPYNWSWDFGDEAVSYLQNPTHNYTTNGTYTVNLTVKDNVSAIDYDTIRVIIGGSPDDDTPEAGWQVIVNESQEFDLIALQNVSVLLGEKELEAGKYTQIRLTINDAKIEVNESGNMTTYSLEIPSHVIKLIHPFTIVKNEITVLTLDFDIYESVHQAGNKFILRPTIKIIEG